MLGENNFNGHVTDYNLNNNISNKNNLTHSKTNKTNNAVNIFSSNNLNQSEAAIYFENNYTDMEISMYNAIKLMHSEAYIKKYEEADQNTIKMAGVWRDLGNELMYSPEKTKQCMIMYRSLLYKFRRIKKKQSNNKLKSDKLNENGKTWKWYNLFEETLPKNKHQSCLMKKKLKKKSENELKYLKIQEELNEIRQMLVDLMKNLQKNKF